MLGRVSSTQDEARRIQLDELEGRSPVLVVADRQVAGRGRAGGEWWEAPRAMYASVAATDVPPLGEFAMAALVAGLAIRDAVSSVCEVGTELKWPNDLMRGDSKVGGLLVEHSSPVLVAGCGVNLWWPDPPPGAGGLLVHDPGPAFAAVLAGAWAGRWLDALARGLGAWDAEAYRQACNTIGADVTWHPDGKGVAIDVADDGGLVVESGTGTTVLRAGEVQHVRSATLPARHSPRNRESDRA